MRLLLSLLCLSLLTTAFAAEVATLDDFAYANDAAVQAAWQPMNASPAPQLLSRDGRQALKIACPFATQATLERGSYDRKVNLDLTTAGAITFDWYADDPTALSNCAIYFHSGEGWYAHSFGVNRGWQKISLSKGVFKVEDKPAGWGKIDTIRVSAWRGRAVDTFCAIANLHARTEDVVVVSGVNAGAESKAAVQVAKTLSDFLAKTGVPFGVLTETDVEAGALAKQKLAIFAYSPSPSKAVIQKVQEYVAGGGKLAWFYSIPPEIAQLLHVAKIQWKKADPSDQFAGIDFVGGKLAGAGPGMGMNSWNVNLFEPGATDVAQVMGVWRDGQNRPQGSAILVSDTGVYVGHVLTETDPGAKQAFLMALVGHYVPGAWETAAKSAIEKAEQIGPFQTRAELDQYLGTVTAEPMAGKIKAALARAAQAERSYKARLVAKEYPEAIADTRALNEALADAYFVSHSSKPREFRAVWNHSGTGDCGTWDEAMQRLKAANFNAVVPNMWWGGLAHYDSKLLPLSATVRDKGDQIAQCVAAGKKYGIEVHPWKVNWNLGNAPAEFIEKMKAEGRLLVNAKGETGKWLCPSKPANYQLELDTMLEVARNYDVDGIHFDYIRYPGSDGCFCDGCRQRFEEKLGKKVEKWPADCTTTLREQWTDFRCGNITRLVKAVSEQAHRLKPNLKVSAAVFSAYPQCRYDVGQDWVLWCKQGYLDFVCPMDYSESDGRFQSLVSNQVALVGKSVPVYAGIGQFIISDDQAAGQAKMSRDLGADGFILFNMGRDLAMRTLPNFAKGLTSAPAVPPHRK